MYKFEFENMVIPFCYDDDGNGSGGEGSGGEGSGGEGSVGEGSVVDATFTQAQVDSMIADRLAKKDKSVAKTLAELEELRTAVGDKDGRLESLNSVIDRLKKEGMTKEQLLREEATTREKVLSDERDGLVSDRDAWKSRYEESTIQTAIVDAAVSAEAVNPNQILNDLGNMTELVIELDGNGKETGRLVPMVNLATTDDSGKKVTLQLTVPEAIKRHKESETNWNLYKSNLKGGFGGSGGSGGNSGDSDDDLSDEEYYAKRLRGDK